MKMGDHVETLLRQGKKKTGFPRDNLFSICHDCMINLKAGDVDELIDAYFGL